MKLINDGYMVGVEYSFAELGQVVEALKKDAGCGCNWGLGFTPNNCHKCVIHESLHFKIMTSDFCGDAKRFAYKYKKHIRGAKTKDGIGAEEFFNSQEYKEDIEHINKARQRDLAPIEYEKIKQKVKQNNSLTSRLEDMDLERLKDNGIRFLGVEAGVDLQDLPEDISHDKISELFLEMDYRGVISCLEAGGYNSIPCKIENNRLNRVIPKFGFDGSCGVDLLLYSKKSLSEMSKLLEIVGR